MPGTSRPSTTATQGVPRFLLVRAARGTEGLRRHGDLPDARSDETEFFERADMMDTKVGQTKQGRSGRSGRGRLRSHAGWRWRCGRGLEEQAAGRRWPTSHRPAPLPRCTAGWPSPAARTKDREKRRRGSSNGQRGLKPQHLLVGAGVGAALVYLYDSTTGPKRRSYGRNEPTLAEVRLEERGVGRR